MESSCRNKVDLLFDEVRKVWVKATPEECVRQKVLRRMVHELLFPKALIVVERELQRLPAAASSPQRRVDILCYGRGKDSLYPLLLVECKQDTIDWRAEQQVVGYNAHVRACFVGLASRNEERFGYLDKRQKKYIFHPGLPSFQDLISWVKST